MESQLKASETFRSGEYAQGGDYHRKLDRSWPYLPVYMEKMRFVRSYLDTLPSHTRVADLGCGEGILVEEYRRKGVDIEGLDFNYASAYVRKGDITELPYPDESKDVILALDVLEHLQFQQQDQAAKEIARVIRPGGRALLALPNLAHLASRVAFLLAGRLLRTSAVERHPGDRPLNEYLRLFERRHMRVVTRRGLFPTAPLLSLLTVAAPALSVPLHRVANSLRPPASLCFVALVELQKDAC